MSQQPGNPQLQPRDVQTGPTKNPVILSIANFLRQHKLLKLRTGINLTNKQTNEFFRYKRCIRALLDNSYEIYRLKQLNSKLNLKLPEIKDEITAQKIFISLIQSQLILPIEKLNLKLIKENNLKLPDKSTPYFNIIQKAVLQPDNYYIWTYQPSNPFLFIYTILGVITIFTIILFPLWPFWMRKGVWYLSVILLGLIVLFFIIAILRLIIYVLTLALPNQFWLFPNLFEDCGFVESFIPFYEWTSPDAKKTKKKSKKPSSSPSSKKLDTTSTTSTTTSEKKPTPKIEEIIDDSEITSNINNTTTTTQSSSGETTSTTKSRNTKKA